MQPKIHLEFIYQGHWLKVKVTAVKSQKTRVVLVKGDFVIRVSATAK